MKKEIYCLWVQVSAELPWTDWWSELCAEKKWPSDLVIERWSGEELNWPHLLDSVNSFTLFKQNKAIVISHSEKALKAEKNPETFLLRFAKGPHRVIFVSEDTKPEKLSELSTWIKEIEEPHKSSDEKAGFRWIDAIHAENLTEAISALERAFAADQHPFALLQLLTRDFRMGRLIHYAHSNRFRESEITQALKMPAFAIQKWLRRPMLQNALWARIFDRLLKADLELKSGSEAEWVIRKLTIDMIQLSNSTGPNMGSKKNFMKKLKQTSQTEPQLWPVLSPMILPGVPSYA